MTPDASALANEQLLCLEHKLPLLSLCLQLLCFDETLQVSEAGSMSIVAEVTDVNRLSTRCSRGDCSVTELDTSDLLPQPAIAS